MIPNSKPATSVINRAQFNHFAARLNIRVTADFCIGAQFSIANSQEFLPLPQIALEACLSATFGCRLLREI